MNAFAVSKSLLVTVPAGMVMTVSSVVLFGWALDIDVLTSILPIWPSMKVNTATGLLFCGIALVLLNERNAPAWRGWLGGAAAAVPALIGIVTVLEYATGRDFGIDTLLTFHQATSSNGAAYPYRPALSTAINLALLGLALLLLDVETRGGFRPTQILTPIAALIALLALMGYLYGAKSLFSINAYASMALHTVLLFLILSVGILAARPDRGWVAIIASTSAGGVMARGMLPAALIMPPLLGWLRWLGQLRGWYDTPFGLAIYTSANVVVFSSLTLLAARTIHGLDLRRKQAASTRFHDLIESTPDAMLVVNPAGLIAHTNSQADALFGYRQTELVGLSIEALLPERLRQAHTGHRAAFFAQPRTRTMGRGLELNGLRKDGREFPVEISLSPMNGEDGPVVISAIRDITERKRYEQTLQEKNLELANANQAKDRFLASMSHELRTPLNAIIGFTGTLLMKLPGPINADQETQLRTVRDSARHLLALINDMLDLAKIEADKFQLDCEVIDCNALVEEVAATLRLQAQAKGLQMSVALPNQALLFRTDRRALRQIMLNLINNAIKFTERGSVHIDVRQIMPDEKRQLQISIKDTGIGVRPEDQRKLFAAFTRVNVPGHAQEGTGLGLHLSQRLASLLAGEISLHSEYGVGSTFSIVLPESIA